MKKQIKLKEIAVDTIKKELDRLNQLGEHLLEELKKKARKNGHLD